MRDGQGLLAPLHPVHPVHPVHSTVYGDDCGHSTAVKEACGRSSMYRTVWPLFRKEPEKVLESVCYQHFPKK